MKKNDLVLVIVVAFFAGVFSMILSNFFFTPSSDKQLKAQKIDAINSNFEQADKRFFNSNAVNPAETIELGDKANSDSSR